MTGKLSRPRPSPPPGLHAVYACLYGFFGARSWWPAETPFEVIVGAILTQNTAWSNVEKAIARLKAAGVLTPRALHRLPLERLARLIVPAGYFRVKARRLKHFLTFLFQEYRGQLARMFAEPLPAARQKLLGVNGIGPETADSILLYAAGKPIFVVDAYTRRIFARHGLIARDASYEEIQQRFMRELRPDASLYNEYHALIVQTGKEFCRRAPRCEECPLGRPELFVPTNPEARRLQRQARRAHGTAPLHAGAS
ncbi:MAG: endonuclease III domain-containing protein [Deltaproteobacteria bacterium]|nr:endonuclease III domain-containing protein [Deltaproteobacteria bacterium]